MESTFKVDKLTAFSALRKQKINSNISKTINYVFLSIMAVFILIPFYWMLNTSFKSTIEANAYPATLFPHEFVPYNYIESMTYHGANFGAYFLNTLGVGIVSTVLGTFLVILAAFAFARLNFKGKNVIFMLFLATMMIPGEMMVISNYVTVSQLGWVSKTNDLEIGPFLAMIVPFLVSVFSVYQLRQQFLQIPNELYYAAKVDGVSDWNYLWKVMIPMSKSSLITIIILKLMGSWNSYVWPNLVGNLSTSLITTALRRTFSDVATGQTVFNLQMAAVIIVTLPLLIVFLIFRKYIMQGMSRSGIKG
jgi:multiple sugar transport system permease protein